MYFICCFLQTTLLSSSSKLHQFAEESQLTQELGGTLPYDHNRWINTRLVSQIFYCAFQKHANSTQGNRC